jgi:hypothetical protein
LWPAGKKQNWPVIFTDVLLHTIYILRQNQYFPNALFHALAQVQAEAQLQIIEHRFPVVRVSIISTSLLRLMLLLQVGHSQMILDSCHMLVERRAREYGPIPTSDHWRQVICTAKKHVPFFEVEELSNLDFINFKKTEGTYARRFCNQKSFWMQYKSYRYDVSDLNAVAVAKNYSLRWEVFTVASDANFKATKAYPHKIPLSERKTKALFTWIEHGVIPLLSLPLVESYLSELPIRGFTKRGKRFTTNITILAEGVRKKYRNMNSADLIHAEDMADSDNE